MKIRLPKVLTLLLPVFGLYHTAFSQCNPTDLSEVIISNVSYTNETCPQNGSITLGTVTGGGGEYAYEIIAGPVIRGIQSQNIFSALLSGTYKIRVTGCSGRYKDSTVNIAKQYRSLNGDSTYIYVNYLDGEGFKCGNTASGKAEISVSLYLGDNWNNPLPPLSDTTKWSLPIRYQVSTSTNFNSSPYQLFRSNDIYHYYGGGGYEYLEYYKIDTLTNLLPSSTYYVRVSDACGVFQTFSFSTGAPSTINYSFQFQVKNPYTIPPYGSEITKRECPQWGEVTVLSGGAAVTSIAENHPNTNYTLTLKRQDNGQIIKTHTYGTGNLHKTATGPGGYISTFNNLIFDSVPRVPVRLEITDGCGNLTNIDANTPEPLPQFDLQAFVYCSGNYRYFRVNPILAQPSGPINVRCYQIVSGSANLIRSHSTNSVYQWYYLPGTTTWAGISADNGTQVPSNGWYAIVYDDYCGRKDSFLYNFQQSGSYSPPTFTFTQFNAACNNGLTSIRVEQTSVSPVISMELINGPSGITYPKAVEYTYVSSSSTGAGGTYMMILDSLPPGSYNFKAVYGCAQEYNTSFNVSPPVYTTPAGTLTMLPEAPGCRSMINGRVSGSAVISSNILGTIPDFPYIRITNAPMNFLQMITHSKNGSLPALPLHLGKFNAYHIDVNGIDTTSINVYPVKTFGSLNGMLYPPGNYTFEMYGSCSGNIISTSSFTVLAGTYTMPGLGATSAYVCSDGQIKITAVPSGGRRPYMFQIKPAADQNESSYSALQADSVFVLPGTVTPGTVYNIRMIDACGNSFVGNVTINSFSAPLYIYSNYWCENGLSKTITAGYIPGATYTWTLPNGSTVVTPSNYITINPFTAANSGTYSVTANALNGCIQRATTRLVYADCYVLEAKLLDFYAKKPGNNLVDLFWTSNEEEKNVAWYEVEKSHDAIKWKQIGKVSGGAYKNSSGGIFAYSFTDDLQVLGNSFIVYYRLRQVFANGKSALSSIRTVDFMYDFSFTSVYPNPFDEKIDISFTTGSSRPVTISLADASGRIVARREYKVQPGAVVVNLKPTGTMQPGMYVLLMQQGKYTITQKLIRKRK